MEKTEPWYYNLYFIFLLFSFSFLILPLIFGLYLLNKKNKLIYIDRKNLEMTEHELNESCSKLNTLDNQYKDLENKYTNLINKYSVLDLNCLSDIKLNIEQKKNIIKELENNHKILVNEVDILQKEKDSLSKEINLLNNELEYIDLGFTKPIFDYNTSEIFKNELKKNKDKQKKLVSDGLAYKAPKKMWLDGSLSKGKQRLKKDINNMLKTFNSDCDIIISKVKYNNLETIENRIKKSFTTLNKLNFDLQIEIKDKYLDLKLKELHLFYGEKLKKQEELENRRIEREILKEEERIKAELKEKREIISKEKSHYSNELNNLSVMLSKDPQNEEIIDKINKYQIKLEEIELNLKNLDYRESNKRAGYVYIISNIGSFGENIFKIGMTRRLEPLDRVRELGDASVPFQFDTHALIFSEDAPSLENAIHKALENKKVNMKNSRKEFFNTSIEEIEKIVKENFTKTVNFTYAAEAEQYNESLLIKKSMNIK